MAAAEASDDYSDDQQGRSQEERKRERLSEIIGRLDREAEDRVGKRSLVEDRWLDDLRQYHGQYSDKIKKDLKERKKSALFINKTRPKTNTMEARISDMLFPTDDRNWGIKPTPVPELMVESRAAGQAAAEAKKELAEQSRDAGQEDPALAQRANELQAAAKELQDVMDEARQRSEFMQEEIEDHLRECNYGIQCRDVIADACKLGTGVLKGPVTGMKMRRRWSLNTKPGSEEYILSDEDDTRPAYWRVDPWNFFPDMDASHMSESEGVFERHLMNKKQLRRLARRSGFQSEAIRRLLVEGPQHSLPDYMAELRSLTGSYHDTQHERFQVWEYHGPLEANEIHDIAMLFDKQDLIDDVESMGVDPLTEVEAVIWFCQGEILKFGLHHLDSGDTIYSVFNLEKDEASVFGFGVPYLMRDPQASLSAAWRMMMDNAALSSGPQVVVNSEVVEPVDGEWTLSAQKLWWRKKGAPKDMKPFEVFEVTSNQTELANIIDISRQNIDDETNLPMIAEGEQGAHVTKTAQGMSMLMNSVNVVFRRIIKNWDDDVTVPNITRMYDFLMQFSDKQHIKGDYQVDARGTSVLLVREIQSGNLLMFLTHFTGHPTLDRYLKDGGLPALRRLVQTMMIPADDLIKSDEQVREDEAKAAENPQPDPEILRLEKDLEVVRLKADSAIQLEYARRETALIQLAANQNWNLEKLRAELQESRAERDSKERMFAAEAAVSQQQGPSGGGHF